MAHERPAVFTAEAWNVIVTVEGVSSADNRPPHPKRPEMVRPSAERVRGPCSHVLMGAGPAQRPPAGGVQPVAAQPATGMTVAAMPRTVNQAIRRSCVTAIRRAAPLAGSNGPTTAEPAAPSRWQATDGP